MGVMDGSPRFLFFFCLTALSSSPLRVLTLRLDHARDAFLKRKGVREINAFLSNYRIRRTFNIEGLTL